MITLGIDIGKQGAIAVFDDGKLQGLMDFQTVQVVRNGKKKSVYDMRSIAMSMASIKPGVAVYEAVHAFPGQGAVSNFEFGYGLGMVEAFCSAFAWQSFPIQPRAWKKHFGLIGQPKEASILVARRLFPGAKIHAKNKVIAAGQADAILIGLYHIEKSKE